MIGSIGKFVLPDFVRLRWARLRARQTPRPKALRPMPARGRSTASQMQQRPSPCGAPVRSAGSPISTAAAGRPLPRRLQCQFAHRAANINVLMSLLPLQSERRTPGRTVMASVASHISVEGMKGPVPEPGSCFVVLWTEPSGTGKWYRVVVCPSLEYPPSTTQNLKSSGRRRTFTSSPTSWELACSLP